MFCYSPAQAERPNLIGVQLDVGAPDGIAPSLVFSPFLYFIKIPVSVTTNCFGLGWRAGVTLDPVKWALGPSYTLEYGAYKSLNLRGVTGEEKLPLVNYSYLNNHLGLEIGNPNGFRFFLRGGFSYIWANTKELEAFINDKQTKTTVTSGELNVEGWIPSAKLGFSVMFL
jgi:hypothetical protein